MFPPASTRFFVPKNKTKQERNIFDRVVFVFKEWVGEGLLHHQSASSSTVSLLIACTCTCVCVCGSVCECVNDDDDDDACLLASELERVCVCV